MSTAGKAILFMVVGTLMLATQDAVSKWLTGRFHAGEILIYRGLFAYIPIALYAMREGGWRVVRTAQPGANLVRAFCNSASGLLVITAYAYMPLADALALNFASPIVLTALAGPLLKEAVGWRRWAAVCAGFAGVLLMVRPSGGAGLDPIVLLPMLSAFSTAARDILTRKLGAVDGPTTILFYTISMSVGVGALTLPFAGCTLPTPSEWAVFLGLGIANGVAHFLIIRAFALAPASLLSPFRYTSLVWAVVLGAIVWGDMPDGWKIAGAALVVASGLYIGHREAMQRRKA